MTLLVLSPPAALFAVLMGPLLFAPARHSPCEPDSDFWLYYHPMAEMAFGMMREGRLPLWNPYLYSGMPLLASIEIGVLYPPNWLHLVVSTDRAFCLLAVFHVTLAGVGMWLYCRGRGRSVESALFSSLAFACAAPTLLHLHTGMMTIVYSSAWCPLIFALIDRCLRVKSLRSVCLLAVVLALQFLAGFPMFTLLLAALIPAYLLVFGVKWSALRSWENLASAARFVAAAALALGLVAPQLLPTLNYLGEVVRGELDYDQATHLSFPATNLLTFVTPDLFGNKSTCPYWGETSLFDAIGFCGATTLLLTAAAAVGARGREFWFWAATAVVVIGLALGKDSFFYDLCFLFVPGVDRFRGVSRLMVFADLALAVLGGLGLDSLVGGLNRGSQRMCWVVGVLAMAAFVAAFVLWLGSGAAPPRFWHDFFAWVRRPGGEYSMNFTVKELQEFVRRGYPLALRGVMLQSAVLLTGCATILLASRFRDAMRFVRITLLVLLGIEIGAFGQQYIILTDTTPWREIAGKTKAALPHESEPFRIAGFSSNPPLPLNRFLYSRLESVGGHENFVLNRYSLFLYKWASIEPEWQTYLTVPNEGNTDDVLNVKYYIARPQGRWVDPDDPLVQEHVFQHGGRSFALYRNRNAKPRAVLIHEAHPVRDLDDAIQSLFLFGKRQIEAGTLLEGDPGVSLAAVSADDRARERITWVDYAPGRCVVDVECNAPALVVFIENYASGWRATIDGEQARLLPANVFMIAVPVKAGRHRVSLSYESPQFRRGCLLAGLSLVVMSGVFGASTWRARRRQA